MLEKMVRAIINKTVAVDYPHAKLPAIVYTRIKLVEQSGGWYVYKLIVLDRFGASDPAYPVLPEVRSKKYFQEGKTVAAALPYGELTPVLLEEVDI